MSMTELQRWLADYGSAWEKRDAEAASRLFADGALYFETPYSEPFRGPQGVKEYWAKVTADQRDVTFHGEPLGVIGNTGIAKWQARFRLASSGDSVELNGVFLLEFDPRSNLCTSLREWWHAR
jgi:ketosteroid isomerase-like protein